MIIMKHIVVRLIAAITIIASLSSCDRHTAAIDTLVAELNSPVFRAEEAKTGLFDDSKAEIDGNRLVITFLCRPYINLSDITEDQLPGLKESAENEFRRNLVNEKFLDGLEALHHEDMKLLMVWQDVNGKKIEIEIDPTKVLPEE